MFNSFSVSSVRHIILNKLKNAAAIKRIPTKTNDKKRMNKRKIELLLVFNQVKLLLVFNQVKLLLVFNQIKYYKSTNDYNNMNI